jgi:hypothetical protein
MASKRKDWARGTWGYNGAGHLKFNGPRTVEKLEQRGDWTYAHLKGGGGWRAYLFEMEAPQWEVLPQKLVISGPQRELPLENPRETW